MAKKHQSIPSQATKPEVQPEITPVTPTPAFNYRDIKSWLYDFKGQAIIVALLAFALYCNTFHHEFAHDDGIVIVKNEFVLEGFAGIPGIMTKDAYHSYYRQLHTTNQLKGGRYRPLSIVTFAIEQQFLGAVKEENVDSVLSQTISYGVSGPNQLTLIHNMNVRHVFNVLWYMLSVVVLLYFLRYIVFNKHPLMALIAAVLFTAHPVHTEVVANVKSRDEIMSLLFMCTTFIFAFRYEDDKKKLWTLGAALLSFFFAFLSKEYAITMLALLPMAFYIFRGYSVYKSINTILPYVVVVTLYLAVRLNAIAPELDGGDGASANALVSGFPLLGTIAAIAALYLYIKPPKQGISDWSLLLGKFWPFVPYFLLSAMYLQQRFAALPEVIESAGKEVLNNPYLFAEDNQKLATEISSTLYYIKFLIFPHPLSADYSFAQIPYVDFGAPMVWVSILVHITIIGLMIMYFPKRKMGESLPGAKPVVSGKAIMSFAIAFYLLHLLMINNLVFDIGATLGERLIYHSSVGFAIVVAWLLVKGAEKIQPLKTGNMVLAAFMIVVVGLMGFKTIDRNKAWKNDSTLFGTDIKTVPNSVLVNANVAASYITLADYESTRAAKEKYLYDAVTILDHTLSIHRKFVAAFLNRGIAWYKLGDIEKATANIDTVRQLYPTYPTLPGMYKLICDFYLKKGWEEYGKLGKYPEAIEVYKKGLSVDSTNVDLWYNMGGAFYTNRQPNEAIYSFQRALKVQPGNKQAQAGLNAAIQMLNSGTPQAVPKNGK
jgi:tetratricopeptide (TPR) repeat protein